MGRKAPQMAEITVQIAELDLDWLGTTAQERGLSVERVLQRMILHERRKDERNRATAQRLGGSA